MLCVVGNMHIFISSSFHQNGKDLSFQTPGQAVPCAGRDGTIIRSSGELINFFYALYILLFMIGFLFIKLSISMCLRFF